MIEEDNMIKRIEAVDPHASSVIFAELPPDWQHNNKWEFENIAKYYTFDLIDQILYGVLQDTIWEFVEQVIDPAIDRAAEEVITILFDMSLHLELIGVDSGEGQDTVLYFAESKDGSTNIDHNMILAIQKMIKRLHEVDWVTELPALWEACL